MLEEKEIKMPIAGIHTTAGLVSIAQLINTTPSEIFALVKKETSEVATQYIIYPSISLPKKDK
uniref:Uncharacterized protein n=1 Tax=Fervidobacterium pennivorans TaxID=93466 RepID=A0A7V4NFW0_FERPE